MAAVLTPPLILGERRQPKSDASPKDDYRPRYCRTQPEQLHHDPAAVHDTMPLTAVAAVIESAPQATVVVDEDDLAAELRTRLALITLQRRAAKRGKQLVFQYVTHQLRLLAEAAGWATAPRQPAFVRPHAGSRPVPDRPHRSTVTAPVSVAPAVEPVTAHAYRTALDVPSRLVPSPLHPPSSQYASLRTTSTAAPSPADVSPVVTHPAPASRRSAQRGAATGRRLRAAPSMAGIRRTLAGACAGAALLFAAVAYPSATVTITPHRETVVVEVPVVVDPTIKTADVATGRLPGRAVTHEVSATESALATGRRTVPDGRAAGEVVLLNRTAQPVQVPRGTILLAGTVRFATQAAVTVAPSRTAGAAQSYGMANARVVAVNGGPAGNVARNQISKIEGPLASSLTVQNNAPTAGGSERAVTFVAEDDRRKLHDTLFRTLTERLNQHVKAQGQQSDKESAIPWAGQNPSVVEALYSRNADEEAASVSLTLKLRYGATIFANDAYNALVQESAASRGAAGIPPGRSIDRRAIQAQPPEVGGVENGQVRLVGRAHVPVMSTVDVAQLRASIAGRPADAARASLHEIPDIAAFDLRTNGTVLGRLPWLGWRIAVVQQPADGANA